jgi:hypothetical protein
MAVLAGSLGGPPGGSRIAYSRVVVGQEEISCEDWVDRKLYVLDPDHLDAAPQRLTAYSDLYELAVAASEDGATTVLSGGASRHDSGVFRVSPADASVSPIQVLGQEVFDAPATVSVSRDGAFATWISVDGRVVVGATDGSEMEALPGGEDRPDEVAYFVSFLPDDRLLVTTALDPEAPADWQIGTMAADGSDRRPTPVDIGGRRLTSVVPSADGSKVILGVWSEAEQMPRYTLVALADGSESALSLPPWAGPPAWSPDGTKLVVSIAPPDTEGRLAVFDVASGSVVTQIAESVGASACAPAWLPAVGPFVLPPPTPVPSGVPLTFEIGELRPARYAIGMFQPNMEATFGAGWQAHRNDADLWATGLLGFPTSQLNMVRIQVGLTGPCSTDDQVSLGPSPTDVVAWLQTRADLTVSDPRPLNLAGYTGVEVDIVGVDGSACPDDPEAAWALFNLGDSWATLFPGERARIATVDVSGRSVSALLFSPINEFDAFILAATPVMDSFAFPAS